jgi:uncharacterized membrane protein YhaH (DUF805 family)
MHWYFHVLKHYAVFRGRASRKEYWYFFGINLAVSLVLMIIDASAGVADSETGIGPLSVIYALAVGIPSLAAFVRRLHDTGHSGWWILIGIAPLVGPIVLLVFLARHGQPGENRFGPNPEEAPGVSAHAQTTREIPAAAAPATSPTAAFCIQCGTRFPTVAAFCPTCGAQRAVQG